MAAMAALDSPSLIACGLTAAYVSGNPTPVRFAHCKALLQHVSSACQREVYSTHP
jgi:hypothetical protein